MSHSKIALPLEESHLCKYLGMFSYVQLPHVTEWGCVWAVGEYHAAAVRVGVHLYV